MALIAACFPAATWAADIVDWRDAARCAGRRCAVSGTVVAQEEEDGATRLYFDAERREVSVLLVRSLFVTWPDYTGRTITATGMVRRFRHQIEVVVSRPRDVDTGGASPETRAESAPVATPPLPPTSPPPTETAAAPDRRRAEPSGVATRAAGVGSEAPRPPGTSPPEEVERLRRRVEELEQRVRELEAESP